MDFHNGERVVPVPLLLCADFNRLLIVGGSDRVRVGRQGCPSVTPVLCTKVIKKLRNRIDSRDQQMVARPYARYARQVR